MTYCKVEAYYYDALNLLKTNIPKERLFPNRSKRTVFGTTCNQHIAFVKKKTAFDYTSKVDEYPLYCAATYTSRKCYL